MSASPMPSFNSSIRGLSPAFHAAMNSAITATPGSSGRPGSVVLVEGSWVVVGVVIVVVGGRLVDGAPVVVVDPGGSVGSEPRVHAEKVRHTITRRVNPLDIP
nr:hypothetical protein [uncultured bacterium]